MYERFTDRARKVMRLAEHEARRLGHNYVGSEHILSGLMMEDAGVAANVLKNLGTDFPSVRGQVEKLAGPGQEPFTAMNLPLNAEAKNVIMHSLEEALNLKHHYVGTEHLLLAVVRNESGLAARVLTNLNLTLLEVRKETLILLGHDVDEDESPEPEPVASTPSSGTTDQAVAVDKPAVAPGTFASRLFPELFSSLVVARIVGLVSESWTVFNVCWGLLALTDLKRAAWPPK